MHSAVGLGAEGRVWRQTERQPGQIAYDRPSGYPRIPWNTMATPPDHSIAALKVRYGERYRWLLLLSVMVGTMASIMSSTIINVAIPNMSQHFTIGQARAQWVTSGFMAAMTVSMLTTPWLLSRYGYRRTYSGCMWLLLVGGVAGGLWVTSACTAGDPIAICSSARGVEVAG